MKTPACTNTRTAIRCGKTHFVGPQYLDGVTLVELMVAITLGLVITAAVVQVFFTSRSSYTVEEGLARVQESGRFAMDMIAHDVRMAGYTGCAARTITPQNNLNSPTDYATDYGPKTFLTGHTYIGATGTNPATDWSPALPAGYFAAAELLPKSDIVVIRRGSEASVAIEEVMPDTSAVLKINGNSSALAKFDIVMITSCTQEKADIFQITGPDSLGSSGTNALVHNTGLGNPGNFRKEFSTTYEQGSEIIKLLTHVYYVGPGVGGKPSLFRKTLSGNEAGKPIFIAEELVEGVEQIKALYGMDTDGDRSANSYLAAKDVAAADWDKTFSMRIGLLVRTLEKVDTQADIAPTDLLGTAYVASGDDRYYRHRAFNSTIQLRN